jgi:sugar phosphate isomerase/epimerase
VKNKDYIFSINTGFAVNRFTDPNEWVSLFSKFIGAKNVQFTADLLNPSLPLDLIHKKVFKTKECLNKYNLNISSTFTGSFTRLNNLTHPDEDFRNYYLNWFKKFVDITTDLGSEKFGSHFGILTQKDYENKDRYFYLKEEAIKSWHKIAEYSKERGIKEISWEPMSIGREFGETIANAVALNNELNNNSPLPFYMCLDVDHGDIKSSNTNDTNPYTWIESCRDQFNMIHLKQSYQNKGGHWPFIEEHNKKGIITPYKILNSLKQSSKKNIELILELSFKERQPTDKLASIQVKDSFDYWNNYL